MFRRIPLWLIVLMGLLLASIVAENAKAEAVPSSGPVSVMELTFN